MPGQHDFLSQPVSMGTTIMAASYDGGVVMGADSRTSTGSCATAGEGLGVPSGDGARPEQALGIAGRAALRGTPNRLNREHPPVGGSPWMHGGCSVPSSQAPPLPPLPAPACRHCQPRDRQDHVPHRLDLHLSLRVGGRHSEPFAIRDGGWVGGCSRACAVQQGRMCGWMAVGRQPLAESVADTCRGS